LNSKPGQGHQTKTPINASEGVCGENLADTQIFCRCPKRRTRKRREQQGRHGFQGKKEESSERGGGCNMIAFKWVKQARGIALGSGKRGKGEGH